MSVVGTFGDAAPTLTAGDSVTGLGGTNSMSLTVSGAAAVADPFAPTTFNGIQTFNIRDVSTNVAVATYDFAAIGGETTVNANLSSHAVSFTGLAAGTTVGVIGNGAVTNNTVSATYAAGATATNLSLVGSIVGGNAISVTNATGITSATINSSGSTTVAGAVVGAITLAGGATVTALTINAGTDLTTGAISGFSTTSPTTMTVTGAGFAAVGTLDATLDTVNASANTGGLRATLSSATAVVTGGAGNDRITTGLALTTGSVDAGAGTGDRLIVSADAAVASTALGALYTGFEVLQVTNGVSVNVTNLSATNTFTAARYTTGGVITNMNATQAAAVTVTAGGNSATFGIRDATNPGTVNTLSITADNAVPNDAITTIDLVTPLAAGVEVVNLTATDNIIVGALTGLASLETLGLSGAGTITITSGALAVNANTVINGSTATGVQTLNFAAATTRGVAFTTGSGNDIIAATAIVGLADVVNAGAGNDRIIGDSNVEVQTLTLVGTVGAAPLAGVGTVVINGTTVTFTQAAAADVTAQATAAAAAINTAAITGVTATSALGVVTVSSAATNGNIAQLTYSTTARVSTGPDVLVAGTPATTTQGAINVSADVITGGAGNDQFFITAGADNSVANADTITDIDFGTATVNADVLNLMSTGLAGTNATIATLTSAQQAAVTAAATLADAVTLVLAATNVAGTAAQFTYGTNTYLSVNVDGGGTYTAAADYLVKITGATGTLSATDIAFIG